MTSFFCTLSEKQLQHINTKVDLKISQVDSETLNKSASGDIKTWEANLLNLFSKPSSPELLFTFKLLMVF